MKSSDLTFENSDFFVLVILFIYPHHTHKPHVQNYQPDFLHVKKKNCLKRKNN